MVERGPQGQEETEAPKDQKRKEIEDDSPGARRYVGITSKLGDSWVQFYSWPGLTSEQIANQISSMLERADELGVAERTRQHLQKLLSQLRGQP
jgi:hypothetical protein